MRALLRLRRFHRNACAFLLGLGRLIGKHLLALLALEGFILRGVGGLKRGAQLVAGCDDLRPGCAFLHHLIVQLLFKFGEALRALHAGALFVAHRRG